MRTQCIRTSITAEWKPIEYPIDYNLYGNYEEKDNEPLNNENNPFKYTVIDEIDILDPNRPHYHFLKWLEGDKIEKGS